MGNSCSPGSRWWCLWWHLFVLSFFPTRCLGWDLRRNWVSFLGISYLLLPTYALFFVKIVLMFGREESKRKKSRKPASKKKRKKKRNLLPSSYTQGFCHFLVYTVTKLVRTHKLIQIQYTFHSCILIFCFLCHFSMLHAGWTILYCFLCTAYCRT